MAAVPRTRALPALLASAAVLAFALQASASGSRSAGADLLPNLVELPPTDIAVVPVAGSTPPRWELRFTSIAGNNGAGPIVVVAQRATAAAPFTVVQRVSRQGSAPRTVPLRTTLSYSDAPGHDHFHLARFERYELLSAQGTVLARDTKAGYCLGDRTELGTARGKRRYVGACGRGRPATLRLEQGITNGWADPYLAGLPGQQFPLAGLAAGTYVLVNRVNDQHTYLETTAADNAAAATLRLAWPGGTSAAPTVTVLGTCVGEGCWASAG